LKLIFVNASASNSFTQKISGRENKKSGGLSSAGAALRILNP
jgi:hypothetical protein